MRINRRDLAVALLGLTAGIAVTAFAQRLDAQTPLSSAVHSFERMPVSATSSGERRAIFDSRTATLDRLETHITTVNAGSAAHDAHRHPDEELVFVREGTLEVTIDGARHLAPAGSVIFFAANDLHGLRNAGDTRASYHVLRWTSPGREGPRPPAVK